MKAMSATSIALSRAIKLSRLLIIDRHGRRGLNQLTAVTDWQMHAPTWKPGRASRASPAESLPVMLKLLCLGQQAGMNH